MSNLIHVINRWVDYGLSRLLVCLMITLVLNVSWQVASRYLLGDPSSVTEEIARFILIWLSLLGAAHALRVKMHLGLDLFTSKLSCSTQRYMEQLACWVTLLFATAVLIIGGGFFCTVTWELKQASAALSIPMVWVYSVVPISGILIVLYSVDLLLPEGAIETPPAVDSPAKIGEVD